MTQRAFSRFLCSCGKIRWINDNKRALWYLVIILMLQRTDTYHCLQTNRWMLTKNGGSPVIPSCLFLDVSKCCKLFVTYQISHYNKFIVPVTSSSIAQKSINNIYSRAWDSCRLQSNLMFSDWKISLITYTTWPISNMNLKSENL